MVAPRNLYNMMSLGQGQLFFTRLVGNAYIISLIFRMRLIFVKFILHYSCGACKSS